VTEPKKYGYNYDQGSRYREEREYNIEQEVDENHTLVKFVFKDKEGYFMRLNKYDCLYAIGKTIQSKHGLTISIDELKVLLGEGHGNDPNTSNSIDRKREGVDQSTRQKVDQLIDELTIAHIDSKSFGLKRTLEKGKNRVYPGTRTDDANIEKMWKKERIDYYLKGIKPKRQRY